MAITALLRIFHLIGFIVL